MSLTIAIVGLPNCGKSTLFNALTHASNAEAANFPFCTIDPNVGIVEVPDKRLSKLAEIVKPEKVIPTVIEFVDIAGLVKGASKGEGLGNKFLGHIRQCDAVAQLIRYFEDQNVAHVAGKIIPKEDLEIIRTELILADLETIQNRKNKLVKQVKSNDPDTRKQLIFVDRIEKILEEGKMAKGIAKNEDEILYMKELHLLTNKSYIYTANVSEEQLKTADVNKIKTELGLHENDVLIPISAKIEEEFIDFSHEEREEYLKEENLKSSGLDEFVKAAYKALGFITFLTAGPKEVRAWTVKQGSTAPEAAGVIHTDFQRGFICAETIMYEDYIKAGSEHEAKEQGKMKTQGKDYIVQDGDIFHFRFNV